LRPQNIGRWSDVSPGKGAAGMTVSLYSDTFEKSPEKLLAVRFVGSIAGCYSLASRQNAGNDVVQVFACRVQSISTVSAVLSAPVLGEVGEQVSAKFDQFPVLTGVVGRLFNGGFTMDFVLSEKERFVLAAKIDWTKKNRFKATRDKRTHKRIMPPNPQSAVTLSDGTVLECFVIDVSRSGVAVSADTNPPIGTRLAVGRAVGTVIRHLEAGFAVRLDQLLDLNDLDPIFQWSLSYVPKDGELSDMESEMTADAEADAKDD
jgi:PilZ domain